MRQLIIEDELKRAKVHKPINPIGTGHCGPILAMHGTEEQKHRYIPPMLSGEEIWCQLFSEPGARTDPDAPKHEGLSYFIVDMHTPGIEVRPIVDASGWHNFNEVFFTDARIP